MFLIEWSPPPPAILGQPSVLRWRRSPRLSPPLCEARGLVPALVTQAALDFPWCQCPPWLVGLVAKSCLTLVTLWTVACQAPLSMGFSRQEHWSGLSFPHPGHLPDPGIKLGSPELHADSLLTELGSAPLHEDHTISIRKGAVTQTTNRRDCWGRRVGGRVECRCKCRWESLLADHTYQTGGKNTGFYRNPIGWGQVPHLTAEETKSHTYRGRKALLGQSSLKWRTKALHSSIYWFIQMYGPSTAQHRCTGEQEGEKDKVPAPKGAHSSGRDRHHKHANRAIAAHETEEKIE